MSYIAPRPVTARNCDIAIDRCSGRTAGIRGMRNRRGSLPRIICWSCFASQAAVSASSGSVLARPMPTRLQWPHVRSFACKNHYRTGLNWQPRNAHRSRRSVRHAGDCGSHRAHIVSDAVKRVGQAHQESRSTRQLLTVAGYVSCPFP